jgi:hypothetical protein
VANVLVHDLKRNRNKINLIEMTETIFFATYSGGGGTKVSDRRQYYKESKTLKEFNDWIEQHRTLLEDVNKDTYIVVAINFIEKK